MSNTTEGVYLDRDTGKITRTKPKRAKVLVQPGHKIPPAVQEILDAAKPTPAPQAPTEDPKPAAKPTKRTRKG